MPANVRKYSSYREEIFSEGGGEADGRPLVKVAVVAVVANPKPGEFQADVLENVPASVEVGRELGRRALELTGDAPVESIGKIAVVGSRGDQEQGVSFLTGDFGDTLRDVVEGSEWVSSVTKRGGPGVMVDIPLASKDFLKSRDHYDTVSFTVPDAPLEAEILVGIGVATRGRLNARCGGLTLADKPSS
jgi:Amino acid synthesis